VRAELFIALACSAVAGYWRFDPYLAGGYRSAKLHDRETGGVSRSRSSEATETGKVPSAAVFAFSLAYLPLFAVAAWWGGWALLAVPVVLWGGASLADYLLPANTRNPTIRMLERRLVWHDRLLLAWTPIQILLIFGTLALITQTDRIGTAEAIGLMACVGIGTGTFGVTYAHELMHRRNRVAKSAAKIILISILYGHFFTEHLRVHHRYVGTPRDAVTARYNESVYRFLLRVLPGSFLSAWQVEAARLRQRGKGAWSLDNPFWQYIGGAAAFLFLAWLVGGWLGIILFLLQTLIAILLTEFVNFVQHYGLTRKHLGGGRYEHTREWHSWNATRPATGYMLVNLQRHSDHHFKPERHYPVLQTYPESTAPHLPFGYPVMVAMATVPQWWRWVMNRRVRRWRAQHYPEIEDWGPYNNMDLPLPQ